jgi:hypothetical protein
MLDECFGGLDSDLAATAACPVLNRPDEFITAVAAVHEEPAGIHDGRFEIDCRAAAEVGMPQY